VLCLMFVLIRQEELWTGTKIKDMQMTEEDI